MADTLDTSLEGSLKNVPGLSEYLAMKQYLARQAQDQRQQGLQQQFDQERQALPADAPPEAFSRLGLKYTQDPKTILQYGMASEDRKAALAQKADAVEKMYNFKIDNMNATLDATLRRITNEEHKTELKNAVDVQKNELTKMKNDILRELGVEKNNKPDKPPSGYRATAEGTLEAIPGGPADLKQQGQFNQDTSSLNESLNSMDRLAQEANAIKEHPGLGGITGVRGIVPNIPGTAPANAQARLDTLKSQVAFGVLQNMRNNSKTGGALGQVSNIEEKMLQDNLAGLGRAQSKEEYQKALQRIIDYTEGAKDRLRKAYNMKHGGSSPQTPQGVDPRVWAVMTPQEKALWQSPQ